MERVCPPHQGIDVVGLQLLGRHHRDDLLGEDVERVADLCHLLDRTLPHPLHDDGRLDQVAAVVGEEDPTGGGADLVTGPPHPLQPARHGRRRLDLHHDIDRTHIDAELQRRGCYYTAQQPGLEVRLDLSALLFAHRAMVGSGNRRNPRAVATGGRAGLSHNLRRWRELFGWLSEPFGIQVVQVGSQPLSQPPGIGEDDG